MAQPPGPTRTPRSRSARRDGRSGPARRRPRRRARCTSDSSRPSRPTTSTGGRSRGPSRWSSSSRASISGMTDQPAAPHRPTLMTVHAHPDDETIGTGGTMAKAVAAGQRVMLVTCTRGEQGEIVVPEMDTPDNHRRLAEIRAGELERAMGILGVTEWENLGYHDSDMMGRAGNVDPRNYLAGRPRRGRPPPGLAHPPLPARRRHDLQRVRRVRPPGPHPDPRRRGPRLPAGRRSRPGTRSS